MSRIPVDRPGWDSDAVVVDGRYVERVPRRAEVRRRLIHEATTPTVLAHRDLGPDHLLTTDGSISGVIDWTDAALDDPAIDLAWTIHGSPAGFRTGLMRAYAPGPPELERSLDRHRLGPWHEVLWALDGGGRRYLRSGLRGVHDRLARRSR